MNNLIRVLFIEDDPDQIFLFGKVFDVRGLLTIAATDGVEALELALKDNPDIILLDVMLKNENGLDVMEKLKQRKETKDIPIFVFTNTDKKEYKDRAEKLGAEQYIIKSETIPQEMAERIKNFIENRKAKAHN